MLAIVSDTGIIVVVVALVMLFGASQIPKLARNVAEAGKEFRKVHAEAAVTPAATPAPVSSLVAAAPMPVPVSEDRVTLTRAELDSMLADREARVRTQT